MTSLTILFELHMIRKYRRTMPSSFLFIEHSLSIMRKILFLIDLNWRKYSSEDELSV
jgi:K+-transporting ATPase A subunit